MTWLKGSWSSFGVDDARDRHSLATSSAAHGVRWIEHGPVGRSVWSQRRSICTRVPAATKVDYSRRRHRARGAGSASTFAVRLCPSWHCLARPKQLLSPSSSTSTVAIEGGAEDEIDTAYDDWSDTPHNGCQSFAFASRFQRDDGVST